MSEYKQNTSSHVSSLRGDIQGLRAFAVLVVVANHLFDWPGGGYVGVDIFFVVSGFLITGLLLREHDRTGRISFRNFYARRFKRIVPAATATILVTSAAAWALLSAQRSLSTLWDAFSATFFVSNWRFAAGSVDYFTADGPVSPLQHFWSLSVEEQFYFVWPLLMITVIFATKHFGGAQSRHKHVPMAIVMGIVVAASLVWAFWETAHLPNVAYFSTLSRAWELGLGALIAISAPLFERIRHHSRVWIAWIGIFGITLSVLIVESDSSFPAPWALLPVVSTALVIVAGIGNEPKYIWPLTNPVSRWIGDLSYSIYLWHFPVIIIGLVLIPEPSALYYVALVSLILALSIASYYWLEEPVRRSSLFRSRRQGVAISRPQKQAAPRRRSKSIIPVAVAILAVGPLGFGVVLTVAPELVRGAVSTSATQDGDVPTDVGPLEREVARAVTATEWPDVEEQISNLQLNDELRRGSGCLNPATLDDDAACVFGDGPKQAVVVGDSVALAWMPAVRPTLESRGFSVKGIAFSTCPFAMVEVNLRMGDAASERCNASRSEVVATINRLDPSLVLVIDSEFSAGQTTGLGSKPAQEWADSRVEAISQIQANGRRVVIIQQNPAGANIQNCYSPVAGPQGCTQRINHAYALKSRGDRAAAAALGIEYIETTSWFAYANKVPPLAGDTIQRVDGGHLTSDYAQLLIGPLAARLFPPE